MDVKKKILITTLVFFAAVQMAAAEETGFVLKEKKPQQKYSVSVSAAMMLDLFPGGGHLYTGHYYAGAVFAAVKGTAAGAVWYSYNFWKDAEQKYRAAERMRRAAGVSNSEPLLGPDGRTRSTDAYKKDYDRSAQYVTFAVIGNLAVYAASWITVWHWCDAVNDKALPSFDVGFTGDMNSSHAGLGMQMSVVKRF